MTERQLARSGVGSVLVVDDDPPILRMVERVLSSRGHTVILAQDARQAIETLRERAVDVLISDLRMPGTSGIALLATARRDFPRVVRVAFSGANDVRLAMRCVNDGEVYRYLAKPCSAAEILSTVDAALGVLERRNSPEPPSVTCDPAVEAGARRAYALSDRRLGELRQLVRRSAVDALSVFMLWAGAGRGFEDSTVVVPKRPVRGH